MEFFTAFLLGGKDSPPPTLPMYLTNHNRPVVMTFDLLLVFPDQTMNEAEDEGWR